MCKNVLLFNQVNLTVIMKFLIKKDRHPYEVSIHDCDFHDRVGFVVLI